MNMMDTALNEVKDSFNPWEKYNPLFVDYLAKIDWATTKSSINFDFNFYIKRDDFETDYFRNTLYNYEHPIHKIEILKANVGVGKTTFTKYLDEIESKKYSNCFFIYVDISILSFDNSYDRVLIRLKESIEFQLIERKIFEDKISLSMHFAKFLGFSDISEQAAYDNFKNKSSAKELFKFINDCIKEIKSIIICFDNIDENSRRFIQEFRYEIRKLNSFFKDHCKDISSTILLPLRTYNSQGMKNSFYITNQYEPTLLRPLDFQTVVLNKVNQVKTLVRQSMEKDYTQVVDNSTFHSFNQKEYTISKERMIEFLGFIAKSFLNDSEIVNFLKAITCNNLKFLNANLFNLFHSHSLPISNFFGYYFSSKRNSKLSPVKISDLIRSLMSVHYPYYDVESSLITNIFSINNFSQKAYDFQNIFGCYRVLSVIANNENVTFLQLQKRMSLIKFDEHYLRSVMKKIFKFGLVDTDNGVHFRQIDEAKDAISISSCGKKYLDYLVFNSIYLQFCSEDSPMPKEYIVPLTIKYESSVINSTDYFENRIKSVKKFINYLKICENLELDYYKKSCGVDKYIILRDYTYSKFNDLTISEIISRKLNKIDEKYTPPNNR